MGKKRQCANCGSKRLKPFAQPLFIDFRKYFHCEVCGKYTEEYIQPRIRVYLYIGILMTFLVILVPTMVILDINQSAAIVYLGLILMIVIVLWILIYKSCIKPGIITIGHDELPKNLGPLIRYPANSIIRLLIILGLVLVFIAWIVWCS